jgi:hypothetical protein
MRFQFPDADCGAVFSFTTASAALAGRTPLLVAETVVSSSNQVSNPFHVFPLKIAQSSRLTLCRAAVKPLAGKIQLS